MAAMNHGTNSRRLLGSAWITFQAAMGMVLLVLLLTRGSLQAQSIQGPGSESQVLSTKGELRRAYVAPLLGVQAGGDRLTSTAAEKKVDGPRTSLVDATSPSDPSSFIVDACPTTASCASVFFDADNSPNSLAAETDRLAETDNRGENSKSSVAVISPSPNPADRNREIYYKNKIEFSLDGGWLPINIPFVFDVFLGDAYDTTSLKYTLVPIIASLRWQIDDIAGPWIFRGNWDLETSGAITVIPRGPETRYFAWIIGFRRNFVPRHGRIAPYFDGRVGLGNIDAKGPAGVLYAQGQDFTFTMNMGSGVRYNLNPRYSISAGLNWMHISNLYLSQPKFANYGINVYGPMFGVNVRLGKLRRHGSE
jgi:hypothetical protein